MQIQIEALTREEQIAHDRACLRAKRYLQAEFELLESIDEVDRLKLYEKFALTSTFSYCQRKLKLTETITAYFIRVARKSREIPELKSAIESGDVPVSKAVKICGVLTPANQAEWIAKATQLPKDKLEKAVAEEAPERPKRAKAKPVGKNHTRVQFEGDDECMEMLKRAQDLESQRKGSRAKVEETLKAALNDYLEKRDPIRKAERAQKKSAMLKPAQPRSGRQPLPASLRHEINLRDRGQCQVRGPDGEICGSTQWIHYHHIIEVQNGGKNELGNMITVCSPHHQLVHRELWH